MTHPDDIKVLVEGLKIVRKIGDSQAFDSFGAKFFDKPFPLCEHLQIESDAYWECYVKSMTTTDHHPIGTCKMGPRFDSMAVVDPRYSMLSNNSNVTLIFCQNPSHLLILAIQLSVCQIIFDYMSTNLLCALLALSRIY